jgi:hypothetical protein
MTCLFVDTEQMERSEEYIWVLKGSILNGICITRSYFLDSKNLQTFYEEIFERDIFFRVISFYLVLLRFQDIKLLCLYFSYSIINENHIST